MKINRKKTALALAISSALILSACGSDGNSGSGSGTSAQLTLTAMDGYIKNALVCADSNENGQCETTEIVRDLNGNYVLTNDKGKIDTQISLDTDALLKKHTMIIATLRSFDPESDIFSEDMDLPNQSMNPIVLRAPAGSSMISPITDLVVSKMQGVQEDEQPSTRAPKMTKEQAQKEVLAALDAIDPDEFLTEEMLYGDYLFDKGSTEGNRLLLAKKNHKVAQIIFESKANAKSDALFDKHAEGVTKNAVTAVNKMELGLLEDTAYKPYVAVGANGASTELVLNNKVKFNKDNMALLAVELGKVEGLYGTHEQWKDRTIYLDGLSPSDEDEDDTRGGIEALITDKDDAAHDEFHDIYISNKTKLAKSNLLVEFQHATELETNRDHILISRADKSKGVPGGTYSILISTNDLKADGEVIKVTDENDVEFDVVSTSVTPLLFTVINENIAPQVNDERLKEINQEIAEWALKQGDIMTSRILDLNGLFTDVNGDTAFEYSMDFNIPGIKVTKESDSIFRISGQPFDVAEGEVMTVTATDNGGLKTEAGITVEIKKGYSELVETLTQSDSIWYQWLSKKDSDGKVSPYCQGIKLTTDTYGYNGDYTAISSANTCPNKQEFDAKKISGTWKANNSDLLLKPIQGKERRYGGIKKHDVAESSNITVFEKRVQPRMRMLSEGELKIDETSKYNGVTLYNGYEAAEKSRQEGTAISLINNRSVIATADATHEKRSDKGESMTFNVSFNATCEALGLKFPENTINYAFNRFEKIQAIVGGEAYDVNLIEPLQSAPEAQNTEAENCLVNFSMGDFSGLEGFAFNQPLAMNFVAKEGSNDSDMFINGLFDKKGTIVPLVDFRIKGNGGPSETDENAIYIGYRYDNGHKVAERFFNRGGYFVRERSEYVIFGEFSSYEEVSTEYTSQYQAKNNKLVYEFKGDCTKNDCKTINLWSDISGEVTIFTHETDPGLNGHYDIYRSWEKVEEFLNNN